MHYFKFRGLAYTFLFAGFLFLFCTLAAIVTAIMVAALWVTGEEFYIYAASISGATFLLARIVLVLLSGRCRCQLCKTPVYKLLKCNKSSQISPLLGSYRLKVALTTTCTGKFRCPYCGEEFDIWAKPLPQAPARPGSGTRTRKAGKTLPGRK